MSKSNQKKYTILQVLDALPLRDRREAIAEIPPLLGISKRQFYRILNMLADDPGEAKPSQLKVIAQFLGVTVDELISQPLNENTPSGV